MSSFCGADCSQCGFGKSNECKGCDASKGCPFGVPCFIARYIAVGGREAYELFAEGLKAEINRLKIPGMPEIKELYPINGAFLNLEYPLPGGNSVKFLDDRAIYLAAQVENERGDGEAPRFFGAAADAGFLLISEYGPNGSDPELILFQKR